MNYDVICSWLGLPAGNWPPDHYTLLGLKPGEDNPTRVDQEVHARLAKLRCYQVCQPDLASEAMNRLAQAFLCLTDPAAKKSYDEQRGGVNDGVAVSSSTSVTDPQQLNWQEAAPPPRATAPAATAPGDATAPTGESGADKAPPPQVGAPVDHVYETAHRSPAARRGLGTPGALLDRVYHTRQLLHAWDLAGKYLNRPQKRLRRPIEEKELSRRLTQLRDLMEDFPPLLGEPGQPGYRVVALARLEMTPTMFKNLDAGQREALARDWLAGRVLLLSHRQFLRHEVKTIRQQTWLGRGVRAIRAALNDHPVYVVASVITVATLIALFWYLV
jgi:hypothetical protein